MVVPLELYKNKFYYSSQLGISKYYDHIVLLYLESRRCRYRSIIFVCFYLYVSVVNFTDYSDMDKMMFYAILSILYIDKTGST
jgi:hypothetical protein